MCLEKKQKTKDEIKQHFNKKIHMYREVKYYYQSNEKLSP